MSIILETINLTKNFGGLRAVDQVNLAIEAGEIRGLIGPNGSGKTTLVNLISGIYQADAGVVKFQDQALTQLSPTQISQAGLLRTFQVPKLFASMTVFDNMMVPHYARTHLLSGGDMAQAEQKADHLLSLAGLTHLHHEPAKHLSGGQQALLQIARGFMVSNIILYLLDEPFAGVNPVIKKAINTLILEENKAANVAFLIISHEMEQIRRLCHRVTALAEGAVIAEGSMAVVAETPAVIAAYLGGSSGKHS